MNDATADLADRWLEQASMRDRTVFDDVYAEKSKVQPEAAVKNAATASRLALESIILRTGRPVLPVRGDRMSTEGAFIESDSLAIIERTRGLEHNFAAAIPSIGRIDVANSMFGMDWVGTAWLVDRDVAVTNRHVAELVAARDGGTFVFRPGKQGAALGVAIDFKREIDSAGAAAFVVEAVLWIETDPTKADIAFLKLTPTNTGARTPIALAGEGDPAPTDVVVIGYPGRAPAHVIPDQELMEAIFAGRYDVKRMAPGLWGNPSVDNWSTHDCTTLGGNSGSVVLDMHTGKAVALHFAGAFLVENYAVPAATVAGYLRDAPWNGGVKRPAETTGVATDGLVVQVAGAATRITIPIEVSITVGSPRGVAI